MTLFIRILVYLGFCALSAGSLVAGVMAIVPPALAVLESSSPTEVAPRIAAWLERRAVAMPPPPAPHGPPLTAEELRAFSAHARKPERVVRIPIVAMTESGPPKATGRSKEQKRTARRSAPEGAGQDFSAARSSEPAFVGTARERYAPERND